MNQTNIPESSLEAVSATGKFVEVLVDVPIQTDQQSGQKLFTYQVPEGLQVQPGDILSVPFGQQQLGAVAIRLLTQAPNQLVLEKIKTVEAILYSGFFPATYPALLQRIADYYQTPLVQVIRAALPSGLLRGSQRRVRLCSELIPLGANEFLNAHTQKMLALLQSVKTGDCSWQTLKKKMGSEQTARRAERDLLKRGWIAVYLEPPKRPKAKLNTMVALAASSSTEINSIDTLTQRQQELLQSLRHVGGEMERSEFLKFCHTTSRTLQNLVDQGYILIQEQEVLRLDQGIDQPMDAPKPLTPAQAKALAVIRQQSQFAQLLLLGVSGSGKTEVYLQAIAPLLAQNQSVLVLVPEIGLTPQLMDRFRARFGEQVFVYHSGLSTGERYDTWRIMTQRQPRIVIGTRSAIFAPLANLGLIILDEEHDNSFKQDQPSPCYHARTVARWRAELENCPLVLGSATPDLETWAEARGLMQKINAKPEPAEPEKAYYLSLPERVQARPMPEIEIVDMRQELRQGNRSIFSRSLQQAIHTLHQQGQQGILFIHRRGHSTFVSCRSCGYVMECPRCDVSLSYHQTHSEATQQLRCHYCNHQQLYPQTCPQCASPYFKHFGSGTQRATQELQRLFPQVKVIRFDSDTTRTKDAHRILLTRFAQGEADLLVGTQMLTKGLDLAAVALVGIISADGLLHLSDYRASERAFQTLVQVAGRAGRGDNPGQVILQTYSPEHPVVQAVQRYEYESLINSELQYRQSCQYPPYSQLVLFRLSGPDSTVVEQTAKQLVEKLTEILQELSITTPDLKAELLGPAPAPIMRIAHQYRWQLLLKFVPYAPLHQLQLQPLRQFCPTSVRLTIDIDPLNFG
ncbi:MAG: primosomal protein N' [Microcoleaceae cyanobacterium]